MQKIEVVENPCEDAIYSIDKFAFRYTEDVKSHMIKLQIELDLKNYEPTDIRFLLADIDSNIKFLLDTPKELTTYIKEIDELNNPNDECLFHDLRTKYIEIIVNEISSEQNVPDEIVILGFTILEDKVYWVIKTFSLYALAAFWDKMTAYFVSKNIVIQAVDNIRWVRLNQYLHQTNEEKTIGGARDFLIRTLTKTNFSRFREIFQQIDKDGYFSKNFYDKVMFQKKVLEGGREVKVQINQISKFFAPYWKYKISTNGQGKDVLCLYDEMPVDENVDDYVYTFKPSLMKYYLQNWFEEFTFEIAKNIDMHGYGVKYILPGNKFNFYLDNLDDNIREIDLVIGVEKERDLKLIAIECKKTLTNKEIQSTNKKCKEKVVDSGNNVFDAFIHIGCFNGDVVFDKKMDGRKEKYKQSIIEGSGENLDVPYYAFAISSIEDYEKKLRYVINDIFTNW